MITKLPKPTPSQGNARLIGAVHAISAWVPPRAGSSKFRHTALWHIVTQSRVRQENADELTIVCNGGASPPVGGQTCICTFGSPGGARLGTSLIEHADVRWRVNSFFSKRIRIRPRGGAGRQGGRARCPTFSLILVCVAGGFTSTTDRTAVHTQGREVPRSGFSTCVT